MKCLSVLLLLFFSINGLLAQGIRGLITDENGETLPYASIYIRETSTGTSSNANGHYELLLSPGSYQVTYQFVGYATQVKQVKVKDAFETLNIGLKPQSKFLDEVSVTATSEDPAFTIMRKAIAKAPYHLVQCDSYSAEVYLKGTGKLTKIPWLARRAIAKEGVDTSRVFTSESISEVSFKRPNTFKERVVSVRTSGEDMQGANPNAYVNASFYQPLVAGSVSPFSPRAFSYYRFRYLGNFMDRGDKIHKIEVRPRSGGGKVFEGTLFIRDKFWNIHSLDLSAHVEIFDIQVVQFFAPVVDEIWMPVTQKYEFSGSVLGFAGFYRYLASLSNYTVVKNSELDESVMLVDEAIEDPPKEIKSISEKQVKQGVQEVFKEDKEVSRKQFKKLMKEYEEQELEESGEEDVLSDLTYRVDTGAAKRDSLYWAQKRPVPLTDAEKKGYQADDSIYVAEQQDSAEARGENRFGLGDLLFGGRFKTGEKGLLILPGLLPRLRFNTVEGFNLDLAATLELNTDTNQGWEIAPTLRYGFSSTKLYGKLRTSLTTGEREWASTWEAEGGRYIQQFHPRAINPFINSLYSLLLERNYMRLYEKDYLFLKYGHNFRYKLEVDASAEWASRSQLFNHSDFKVFESEGREYDSNAPVNIENAFSPFDWSEAFKTSLALRWKPWLKFRKYNGVLRPIEDSSPEFRLGLHSGWEGIAGSDVDFQQVELGIKDEWKLGVRATFEFDVEGGGFLRNDKLLFMDYKHFDGGLTELAPLSVTGNFRALGYYLYSTDNAYVSALSYLRFRKFLFTQIPLVRLTGLKENLFVNYLKTTRSPHYWEVGYGIDNIFRIFRVEFVQTFNDLEPNTFAVRVGVASIFSIGRR